MMQRVFGFLLTCTLFGTGPAAAQENRAWLQRTFLAIDVPFQPLNNDFSESLSFADAVKKTENVTFAAAYEPARGAGVDVGGGVRLAGNLGLGVTVSWFQHASSASFALAIPSPLVANRPLALTGTVPDWIGRSLAFTFRRCTQCRSANVDG